MKNTNEFIKDLDLLIEEGAKIKEIKTVSQSDIARKYGMSRQLLAHHLKQREQKQKG